MHGTVQPPSRWIRCPRFIHRRGIIGIDQQQIARTDPREMHLIGIHQKLCAILIDCKREVIRNRLVKIHSRSPPKRRSKFDPLLLKGRLLLDCLHLVCHGFLLFLSARSDNDACHSGRCQP